MQEKKKNSVWSAESLGSRAGPGGLTADSRIFSWMEEEGAAWSEDFRGVKF